MRSKDILNQIINYSTGGYFYKDNCRLNWNGEQFYCKDFTNGKMKTYSISNREASNKVNKSFKRI